MSCDQDTKKFTDAANVYVSLDDELRKLQLSWVATPGSPPKQVIEGGEEWRRAKRLTEQRDAAYERYRAASVAYMEAVRRHRD